MKNTTDENKRAVTYFCNDTYDIIRADAQDAMEDPGFAIESGLLSVEDFVHFVTNYVKYRNHSNAEKVKEELKKVDVFDDSDVENMLAPLIHEFFEDDKAIGALEEEFTDALYEDHDKIDFMLEDMREMANEDLKADGFIGNDEKYIIIGTDLGWRHRSGYKMATINSEEDLEKAVTGNYDYIISIERKGRNTPWLSVSVSTHDAPTGEFYTCIPVKWLSKAIKSKAIQELVNRFDNYIEADLEALA